MKQKSHDAKYITDALSRTLKPHKGFSIRVSSKTFNSDNSFSKVINPKQKSNTKLIIK